MADQPVEQLVQPRFVVDDLWPLVLSPFFFLGSLAVIPAPVATRRSLAFGAGLGTVIAVIIMSTCVIVLHEPAASSYFVATLQAVSCTHLCQRRRKDNYPVLSRSSIIQIPYNYRRLRSPCVGMGIKSSSHGFLVRNDLKDRPHRSLSMISAYIIGNVWRVNS